MERTHQTTSSPHLRPTSSILLLLPSAQTSSSRQTSSRA
jgi:hypothetical protein